MVRLWLKPSEGDVCCHPVAVVSGTSRRSGKKSYGVVRARFVPRTDPWRGKELRCAAHALDLAQRVGVVLFDRALVGVLAGRGVGAELLLGLGGLYRCVLCMLGRFVRGLGGRDRLLEAVAVRPGQRLLVL
jgi:hypothetical protein